MSTANEIDQLSSITKLEREKIKRWLENKRRSKKIPTRRNHLTSEEKFILQNYFETTTDHPGPQDLNYLKGVINKDEKKIRAWFNQERYKLKNIFQTEETFCNSKNSI